MRIDWQRFHAEIRYTGHYRWGVAQPDYAPSLYDHMLWVVTDGEAELQHPSGRADLGRGSCVWYKPGTSVQIRQTRGRLAMYSLVFSLKDARGRDRGIDWRQPDDLLAEPQPGFAAAVAERLQSLADEPHPHLRAAFSESRRAVANQLLTALLMDLDRHNDRGDQHPRPAVSELQRRLFALAQEVSSDPGNAPEPGEQARLLGTSHTHLCRLYRQTFQLSPQAFMVRFRIRHARRLLIETDASIGAIAEQLGYRSAAFFSRQFKQMVGRSPQAWRRDVCQAAVSPGPGGRDPAGG